MFWHRYIPSCVGFQSTLPLRGATWTWQKHPSGWTISIHAPLTGSDRSKLRSNGSLKNFNPRSPYGERPLRPDAQVWDIDNFNPRSPCGGRRVSGATGGAWCVISIHAPLTGSDFFYQIISRSSHPFQSTLPLRGATYRTSVGTRASKFQSTLPLRGATTCFSQVKKL